MYQREIDVNNLHPTSRADLAQEHNLANTAPKLKHCTLTNQQIIEAVSQEMTDAMDTMIKDDTMTR